MHIVTTEYLAQTDSLIKYLFVIIAVLLVLAVALIGYALGVAIEYNKLEEEAERLERRIDRLTQQIETINK